MERRLTTILAADIVGYSRLMGEDEAGTLTALKSLRQELVKPKASQYHGRTVKLMGDGVLMEFSSVVDTVQFAVEVQVAMAERNVNVPEDRRIVYRIGINIGDIIVEGDDIYGDGVNVAARLEELSEPGGVCIARNVFNQVQGKLDLTFEHLGEKAVKNIAKPVSVYRINLDDKAAALVTPVVHEAVKPDRRWGLIATAAVAVLVLALGGAFWWQPWAPDVEPASVERMALPDKPSIAVLAFDNLSGDPEFDPVSDGITEDIIAGLSRSPDLLVIARNSSFTYKNKPSKVQDVARDLGVRYVLEGSVRRIGDGVRIVAQLIDAKTDHHVWAERYEEEDSDIYTAIDAVTDKIVSSLIGDEGRIKYAEYRKAWGKDTASLGEYDYYIRGHSYFMRFTKADMARAREIFQQGLSRFPESALLRTKVAWTYMQDARFGWSEAPARDLERAFKLATASLADVRRGPRAEFYGHFLLAYYYLRTRNFDRAVAEMKATLELAPYDPFTLVSSCQIFLYAGRPDDCLKNVMEGSRRNPYTPWWYYRYRGWAYHMKGQYHEAVESLRNVGRFDLSKNRILASSYVRLGQIDEAKRLVAEILENDPRMSLARLRKLLPYKEQEQLERELTDLRNAGLPE